MSDAKSKTNGLRDRISSEQRMLQFLPDLTDALSLPGVKHAPSLGEGKTLTIAAPMIS